MAGAAIVAAPAVTGITRTTAAARLLLLRIAIPIAPPLTATAMPTTARLIRALWRARTVRMRRTSLRVSLRRPPLGGNRGRTVTRDGARGTLHSGLTGNRRRRSTLPVSLRARLPVSLSRLAGLTRLWLTGLTGDASTTTPPTTAATTTTFSRETRLTGLPRRKLRLGRLAGLPLLSLWRTRRTLGAEILRRVAPRFGTRRRGSARSIGERRAFG